jgi:two-component system phosphate regulon sensor histidine kinase PhoR
LRLGLRGKLILACLGLIALSMFAADAYLSSALDRALTRRIADDLAVRLALAERSVAQAEIAGPGAAGAAGATERDAWDRLADDLGERARARVSIIALDGTVLGDSQVDRAALDRVENHAGRPEVKQALAEGRGAAVRLSDTVRQRMMYAALPLRRDGRTIGVVRAAVALTDVDAAVGRVRGLLLVASLVAFAVAALASTIAAHRMTRVVRRVTDTARRMSEGDLDARSRVGGRDELGELGRTLDKLAGGLSASLAELRSERDRMAGILQSMDEGVLLLDTDGRIAMINPALREMLLLGSEVVGRSLLEVIRHSPLRKLLEQAREGTVVSGEVEIEGVKPRRMLVRASLLRGDPGGVLAVFFDVTELRRLETLRRDFVANVSHELRTPITAVRSAAETLRSGAAADPTASARFLDILDRNAERLQHLVEDLLDLSRIESRQFQLQPESIPMAPALAHAVSLSRERAEKKRITLDARAPQELVATADRRVLEQVLANLIDNAIKYSGAGCRVDVEARAAGDVVEVAVRDDGPGIEARHLPRLFERFYRVDAGRSRDQGGTGLGLSIVKHLVEAMGGRVSVESTPGKGSTFSFTLPLPR